MLKSDTMITSSSSVFETMASYYNPASKKWDTGCFTLCKNYIQFISTSSKDEQFHLCLPLSTITGLEKRQSNLIYPSLVICVGSEKHWFGSFSSRDAVYNLLELFWRESLITKPYMQFRPSKASKSNSLLGKELLEILCESKNTLIETANVLSDQSRQLYDAEEAINDMNNDLTTAEEAIKSLSFPLAFADVNKDDENSKLLPLHRYKVTFSFSNSENKIDWEKGVLVVSNDIILLNKEHENLMQVTMGELQVLQVLSPWELCIVYTFSGIKVSCYCMCPQLSRLLKFLSSISDYQKKIVYLDEDSSVYDTASCSSTSSHRSTDTPSTSKPTAPLNSLGKVDSNSGQTEVNASTLSEQEIQELNSVLQNLQTLAVEVGREQENQMERINTLKENMERADIRIKKTNSSLKKKA